MATLTDAQARQYAQQAGFSGSSLDIIVAIAHAESGLNTQAQNCNNPGGSCDRGIVQINNYWHSEVNDSCAYNPACAFQAAYRISSSGTNFNPWTTYTSGAYKPFLSTSTSTSTSQPTTQSTTGFNLGSGLARIGMGILGGLLIIVGVIAGALVIMDKEPTKVIGSAVKGAKWF